jgi:tetratricopeptide (TPR) repeat protein
MMHRSAKLSSLFLLLLFNIWVPPALAQWEQRHEQYSPIGERHWKDRIQRNPRDAKAHYNLGRSYEMSRRVQLAAESYRQATLIEPGWPEAFFFLGKAYRELARFQEAAVALERAVLLKPNYTMAYHYLGLTKINLGRIEEAAEALLKAYTLNPGKFEVYYDNTTYGIHNEIGNNKETTLAVIKHIYPHNQQLARLLYNNWARGVAAMKEYWETVSGRTLPGDKGYQAPPIYGYQPVIPGYQKPQDMGFQRKQNQPSAPEELAD